MDRSKLIAVITGAIALLLGIGYLLLVQILDFRGEMLPAPQSQLMPSTTVQTATVAPANQEFLVPVPLPVRFV